MTKITDAQAALLDQLIPQADNAAEVEAAGGDFTEVVLWVANALWQLNYARCEKSVRIETAMTAEIGELGVQLFQKKGWNVKFVKATMPGSGSYAVFTRA